MAPRTYDLPLTASEVANIFNVTTEAVGRWADEGLLPCFRTPGGRRRFRRADVESFVPVPDDATTEAS